MGLLQVLWLVLPANLSARQVAATLVAVMIPIERRGEGAKIPILDLPPGRASRSHCPAILRLFDQRNELSMRECVTFHSGVP